MGSIHTGGEARGIRIMKKEPEIYALLADRNGGFKIIKITDPKNPVVVDEHYSISAHAVCTMV